MLALLSMSTLFCISGRCSVLQMPHYLPGWVRVEWPTRDPLAGAWSPFASALKANPAYVESSSWPEKAKKATAVLGSHPSARKLYEATASYLVARDLDWRFELGPPQQAPEWRFGDSALYSKLKRAWAEFAPDPASREFSRIGFALCSCDGDFDAQRMPEALAKLYPGDRLVISSLVWYSRCRRAPNAGRSAWTLTQAKRLPSLPDARPQDYVTLAAAYGADGWITHSLTDAIGYRDNMVEAQRRMPAEYAPRFDKDLQEVNKYIREHGGGAP